MKERAFINLLVHNVSAMPVQCRAVDGVSVVRLFD